MRNDLFTEQFVPILVDIVTLLKCLCDIVDICVLVKLIKMSFFFLIFSIALLYCSTIMVNKDEYDMLPWAHTESAPQTASRAV